MSKDDAVEKELQKEEQQVTDKKKMKLFGNLFTNEKADSQNQNKSFLQRVGIQKLCILLVLGILLIILCYQKDSDTNSEKKESNNKTVTANDSLEANPIYTQTESETEEYVAKLEEKLKKILSKVNGIGDVDVMITLAESKELVTLKDTPYTQDSVNENDGEGGTRSSDTITREDETVMSTTEDGATTPYIIKEVQPTISGVLVIAEGGKDAVIQMDIVEAVEALFDLPVHKIKVMEMDSGK